MRSIARQPTTFAPQRILDLLRKMSTSLEKIKKTIHAIAMVIAVANGEQNKILVYPRLTTGTENLSHKYLCPYPQYLCLWVV